MNKHERAELTKCEELAKHIDRLPFTAEAERENLIGVLARSMGTLARAASSHKAYRELTDAAERMNVRWHGEFIDCQWSAA